MAVTVAILLRCMAVTVAITPPPTCPPTEARRSHTFEERGFSDLFPHLPALTDLRITACSDTMTSGALHALRALPLLTRLEVRGLAGSVYPPHLAFLSALTGLRTLALTTPSGESDDGASADAAQGEAGLAGFPRVILALTQLESLDLSGHLFLDHVPPDVTALRCLRELVVQDTSLSMQPVLGMLPSLTRLDMQTNPMVRPMPRLISISTA